MGTEKMLAALKREQTRVRGPHHTISCAYCTYFIPVVEKLFLSFLAHHVHFWWIISSKFFESVKTPFCEYKGQAQSNLTASV